MMDLRINHKDILSDLYNFTTTGSGVLTGRPGVGKSYELKKLVNYLEIQDFTVLFLPIDKIIAETDSDLQKELNLKSEIYSYLASDGNVSPQKKGIVIIDAFDAARSGNKRILYLKLIQKIKERLSNNWNVLVAVRIYDAKKSSELLNLFPKDGKTDQNLQLKTLEIAKEIPCRHVILPELNSEDIINILNKHPLLSKYSRDFNPRLKCLLSSPYNVSLIENLIQIENDTVKLNSVFSEVQLLDLYWKLKIEQSTPIINHQILLNKITEKMVLTHSLSVSISDLPFISDDHSWEHLFSNEILVVIGINKNKIAYSHNILFDYAVSKLAIDDNENGLVKFLKSDKSNAIFLIPSIQYYLTKIWYNDKELFKYILLNLYKTDESEIPFIAKTIPVRVLTLEARSSDDLKFLLGFFEYSPDFKTWLHSRTIQALISSESEFESSVRPDHKFWLSFIEYLIHNPKDIQNGKNHRDLVFLNWIYKIQSKDKNSDIQRKIGEISRNILSVCLELRKHDSCIDKFASNLPILLVVKTFGTDPVKSREVLEKIFEIAKEDDFELSYLRTLAYNLNEIFPFDQEFVFQFYTFIFSRTEDSTKQTEMGNTGIFQLTSNRRQDYGAIRYHLGQESGALLDSDLKFGLRTLIKSINYGVCRQHILPYIREGHSIKERIINFPFNKKESKYLDDFSYIWYNSHFQMESEFEILNQIKNRIIKISQSPDDKPSLEIALNEYGDHAIVAILWRDLIKIASANPEPFSSVIVDLISAKPIQIHSETMNEIAELIEKSIQFLSEDDIIHIVTSILKTDDEMDSQKQDKYLVEKRNFLLSKIPSKFLPTVEIRSAVQVYLKNYCAPPRKPIEIGETEIGFVSEQDILEDKEIDSNLSENKLILPSISSIKSFNDKWINEQISEADALLILEPFKELLRLVEDKKLRIPHNTIVYAWEELSRCAKIISRGLKNPKSELYDYSRKVLLESANDLSNQKNEGFAPDYDPLSWSPTPVTDAAEGLLHLYSLKESDEIWRSIDKLSRDRNPVVRRIILSDLDLLVENSPKKYWEKIDEFIDNEKNYKIYEIICHSLNQAFKKNRNNLSNIEKRLSSIWKKFEKVGNPGIELINNNCFIASMGYFAFLKEAGWAKIFFDEVSQKPESYSKIRRKVVSLVISHYFKKPTIFKPEYNIARSLTSKWLDQILRSVFVEIEHFLICHEEYDEGDKEQFEDLYGVIDEYITRFYFVLEKKYNKIDDTENLSQAIQTIYKLEKTTIEFVLDEILRINRIDNRFILRGGEIQYMMGILDSCLSHDPKNVLKLAIKILKIGNVIGYSSYYLGNIEIEKFIGHLLADHREILEERMTMENFTELLDNYVKGNNPEAMKLIMSIDLIND
jgi:hypothetical protein